MTLAGIGTTGFVYITAADGTTIVANINNTASAISIYETIDKALSSSSPLTSATAIFDSAVGSRVFGNTAGVEGNLAGAVEMTRFFVERAANASIFKIPFIIAGGIVATNRVTNNMTLVLDTEGLAASDTLDTLTIADVVDNDEVTIVGTAAARIITVAHGTGNIFLSNNANFATAGRQFEIVLKYFSAATTGWYEVSRGNTLPTVANQRAVLVPTQVSGVNATALTAGGGTINVESAVDKGMQVYTSAGLVVLAASWVIQPTAAPVVAYLDGEVIEIDYRATLTAGANTVTIFGLALTTTQALEGVVSVRAEYKLSNTTWYARLYYNRTGIDIASVAFTAGAYEPVLGNPASDGMGLVSTALGVRSWSANTLEWTLLGNAGTVDGTNFIGTTDNIPFNIRVNNQKAGRIQGATPFLTTLGYQAGNVSTGVENTFLGFQAGLVNTTGLANTASGYNALRNNIIGNDNTASGVGALFATIGSSNTANGYSALSANTTGSNNTACGAQSLLTNTTGSDNTVLGFNANVASNALIYATAIGSYALVAKSYTVQLGNASVVAIVTSGNSVTRNQTLSAIDANATATAAQIVSGYITSTSAAATLITLPTAAQILTEIGGTAVRGTSLYFIVDNQAGASVVTVAVGANITVLSTIVITGSATLTVDIASVAKFQLIFTTATAARLIRIS